MNKNESLMTADYGVEDHAWRENRTKSVTRVKVWNGTRITYGVEVDVWGEIKHNLVSENCNDIYIT